jgi:hypothetical protein
VDFMRLLKSLEELLYELVTWILFYPLTLWRAVRHPLQTMRYAQAELDVAVDEQFDDTLNPPVFLLITLFLAHLAELHFASADGAALPTILQDDRNLLAFRAIAFSVFPLLLAVVTIRLKGARLTRRLLKPAFYSQCFVAAPFVLALDVATLIGRHSASFGLPMALTTIVLALTWYLCVQALWFTALGMSKATAPFAAVGTVLLGVVVLVAVSLITALASGMRVPV